MNNSFIEQEFINWCNQIHPDINPYIFIHRHTRYSEEYLPLIEENMTNIHSAIRAKKPNVNFSLKGRIKSKRSFLIKSFRTIAENIEAIFSNSSDDAEKEQLIKKYFKFLINENPEKYEEIKKIITTVTPALNTLDSFAVVFNKLSPDEKTKLVTRLGRTEDTFAYRPIIHSVDFPIKEIKKNSDNSFSIIDTEGNEIPIFTAIKFNPKTDIISKENGIAHINVNGKLEKLNDRNLLYPQDISSNNRNLEHSLIDENGLATLLGDSLMLTSGESLDIISIEQNQKNNSIYITDSNGDYRNLSALLAKGKVKLRKHDEDTIIKELYNIYGIIQEYYTSHNLKSIASRYKDYIQNPKEKTEYMSIHDSSFNEIYGYTMEGQIRSIKMEDDSKNESSNVGHDFFKKEKINDFRKNSILAKILEQDITAFDSSTPTLMKILENRNVELSDILGKYILTTTTSDNKSISYQPPINVVFEHIFKNASSVSDSSESPILDFSSYKNFIASRKTRNNMRENESKFPDLYDE